MRRLALLCVALLAAGCYDSRFGERGDDATPEPVTATIRQLREKFAGTTFPVTGDIVVSGRVTTSDYDENFYRTFCIEEDGAGIEVMAGIDHLHNDFPEGCQVTGAWRWAKATGYCRPGGCPPQEAGSQPIT